MSDKKISYLSRDFSSVRKELEKFSKQYYPELSDDWNDSSVGSWLMDLAASVGDDLAYHTDRMYQECEHEKQRIITSKEQWIEDSRKKGFFM